jgi:hypothetical protein
MRSPLLPSRNPHPSYRVPRAALAALVFGAIVPAVAAQALVPYGSFEDGETDPTGRGLRPGCSRVGVSPHRGAWQLRGESAVGSVIAAGAEFGLEPEVDYRLVGWLRSPAGQARLELELLDEEKRTVRQVIAAPAVEAADKVAGR